MSWSSGESGGGTEDTGEIGTAPWADLGPSEPVGAAARGPGGRRVNRAVFALIVVALLVAGVTASFTLARGGSQGAGNPDTAVRNLLAAAQNSDILGVLDTLVPAERDALKSGITETTSQLQRLGVLNSNTDLSNLGGVHITFSNVTTSTTNLRSDLAAVSFTGGTVTSQVDPSQVPLGSFTRSVAGSALSRAKRATTTSPLNSGKAVIMTEQVGGNWYVSLGYTIAENARRSGASATPGPGLPGQAVPATGSGSPQEAVKSFLQSLANLDLQGIIEDTPPIEFAALHDYASLFLPAAEDALAKVKPKLSISITNLSLVSQPLSDGSELVTITNIGLHVTYAQTTVDYANGCVTISDGSDPSHNGSFCLKDLSSLAQGAVGQLPPALQKVVQDLRNLHATEGLVAVQENGGWYLDPVRTTFTDIDNLLAAITPADMNDIEHAVVQLRSGSSSSSSSSGGSSSTGTTGSTGSSGNSGTG